MFGGCQGFYSAESLTLLKPLLSSLLAHAACYITICGCHKMMARAQCETQCEIHVVKVLRLCQSKQNDLKVDEFQQ